MWRDLTFLYKWRPSYFNFKPQYIDPVPRNMSKIHSSIYHRFVKDFSKIARLLHDLLKCEEEPRGNKHRAKSKRKNANSAVKFQWETQHQEAFEKLKTLLTTTPVLAFANFDLPFILHTDPSRDGRGAILYQTQDGNQRPIAFASRGLSPSERNYPAHKLEFLAPKWAITNKYRDYLYGKKFSVHTDNNPLTYILSTARLDATGQTLGI